MEVKVPETNFYRIMKVLSVPKRNFHGFRFLTNLFATGGTAVFDHDGGLIQSAVSLYSCCSPVSLS